MKVSSPKARLCFRYNWLGFRVQGVGFGFLGKGSRVWGARSVTCSLVSGKVQILQFIYGSGFRA